MMNALTRAWTKLMDWIDNAIHFVDWLIGDPAPTNKFLKEPGIRARPAPDKRPDR